MALSGFGAMGLNTTAQAASVDASDLMFSVYIEGSANNKAIEVYNPTESAIELSEYTISLYDNGKDVANQNFTPEAQSLEAGGYFVIYNGQASNELKALGNVSAGVANYNGDDVLTLMKGSTVLDSIGQIGDRGNGKFWGTDPVVTAEKTLTKTACTVDNDATDAYDPAVDFTASDQNDFSTLGTLDCDAVAPTDPPTTDPPVDGISLIGAVQGDGPASPMDGDTVTIQGHVVGSFQGDNQFNGYYVQDAGDENDATSDGIFVYAPGQSVLANGTHAKVTGKVSEYQGQTQLNQTAVEVQAEAGTAPAATELTVPVEDPERYEGMLVTFPAELTILEYFNFGRFGEIVVGPERQYTPTAVLEPGPVAAALAAQNAGRKLIIDDGRANQNPDPAIHPDGMPFTTENYFRGGDKLGDVTGVLSYRNNDYKLQLTEGAEHIVANPRPEVPDVGGDFTVASYNVLNYFTTLTSESSSARGADTADEFDRQQIKIVEALAAIDADVFGLIEIENNGLAVENLVTALNSNIGSETYKAVNTQVLGSDAIVQAFIYKPATTELSGKWNAFDFEDQKNRPVLVQTFEHKASGEKVNVSVNHLKSKGSNCNSLGDPDLGDGAGNCNVTRTKAAEAMATYLAGDPTEQGVERSIILGDLNSYDFEDPIDALKSAGYMDLMKEYQGEKAYSYVFDGQIGYLDYAMANDAAGADVSGTAAWHINADEVSVLDYNLVTVLRDGTRIDLQNIWAADPYRSSDHDPVIVGMQLGEVATPSPLPTPTVTVTGKPSPAPTVTVTAKPTPPKKSPTRPIGLPNTGN